LPTILIDRDYTGTVQYIPPNYTKLPDPMFMGMYEAAKGVYYYYRGFARFPLTSLPAGSTVTQVRFNFYCYTGGAAHLLDIHAYGVAGQENPETDGAETCYNRCASGNLYVDDSDALRTIGDKWFLLGGTVCADVQNAKSAVNRFSLGLHEEEDNDPYAGAYVPILEITYTPPPVVWGGSALPQLEMAKAILGL